MFSPVKQFKSLSPRLQFAAYQLRYARTDAGANRRRSKSPAFTAKKTDQKSEWWIVDGEMHEIGDHVPPRERFVIPRDNVPNRRRKQLREQFMRRTRLVLKESNSYSSRNTDLRMYIACASAGSKRFEEMKDQGFGRNKQGDTWEKVNQIRDKFEYDREKRMAEKAFAPMNRGIPSELPNPNFRNQPFDTQRYFADERD
ncbi:hypothetical protein GH714_025225 [Hevea brasiliensis]|uniref:Uncharacterized protein n=1 Tax=Hevea brasiliensis TaxID=3981 RepID=A0A6A6KYJ8_HEVBR|nr:hypothetical protein GH714_025225 [Hevea brasiliensis]